MGSKRKPANPATPTDASELQAGEVARWESLDNIRPWSRNPRRNEGRPTADTINSIKRYGWGRTLVARSDGEIIVGHTARLAALELVRMYPRAKDRDEWHPQAVLTATKRVVPVRFRDDLSEQHAHELAVADNKTAEGSSWAGDELSSLLVEWDEAGAELDALGFDDAELAKAMGTNYKSEVTELDVSDLEEVEFFIQVRGPLVAQPDALDKLREALQSIEGVTVEMVTT